MSAVITEPEAPVAPGLRERQREARDEAILAAAYALIDEKGYDAMTMDELADRVGISKRTLYHHFESKDAIASRTVAVCMAASNLHVATAFEQLEPVQRLEAVVRWVIDQKINPPTGPLAVFKSRPALMLQIRTCSEYREAYRSYVSTFSSIVRQAQEAGGVAPDLDPEVVSQMLFSVMRGIDRDEMLAGGASPEEVVETLVRSILGGIRSKP